MFDRDRHQADLLDQFRQERTTNPDATPPDGLDSGVAAIAVMLEDELSPPGPSAEFVRGLERRFGADAVELAPSPSGAFLPSTAHGRGAGGEGPITSAWPIDDPPRRSRFAEFARIAAAGLIIMLVGSVFILFFSDADDAVAPGIGDTEETPVPTPVPPASVEVPSAQMEHGEQTQVGMLAYACYWFEFPPECLEEGALLFPGEPLEIAPDDAITFNFSDLSGAAEVNVRAYAHHLDADQAVDLPDGNQVLVQEEPQELALETARAGDGWTITVNLPPGNYAIGVDATVEFDDAAATTGSATYGFHIHVIDGLAEAESPPATWLAFGDQSQRGEFAYGCMWPGFPMCVYPAGLTFPEDVMEVPQGADLTFTIDGMEAEELLLVVVAFPLGDDVEMRDGTWFLPYPQAPYPQSSDIPFDPAAPSIALSNLHDLAPGEYAIEITVSLNSDGEATTVGGSGTYGFHIGVPDEAGNIPNGIEAEPFDPTAFDRYPVWSLGDTFGEFVLDRVVHHESSDDDRVEYVYVAEDGRSGVGIVITSQGALTEMQLRAREESRQSLGESIVVNGETGWRTPIDDNATMIELELHSGYLTVFATDRETAIAAAEAVEQVNIRVTEEGAINWDWGTTGTIVGFEPSSELGTIHIAEHPDDPNAGEQFIVTITPETRVSERTADGIEQRTFDDLETGMRVVVAFDGPVADSYPGLARASDVAIIRTETDGPTDPNNTVTMSFRHSLFGSSSGGDAFYVAYDITGGESGETFFCGEGRERVEDCGDSGNTYRVQVEIPRGAELTFSVYRIAGENPDEPELVESGREVVDMDMSTRSHYRYHAEGNPGGYD